MAEFQKIAYYNLRAEAEHHALPRFVGRREEMERMLRVLNRRINNNCFLVGPRGIGKTALVYGLMQRIAKDPRYAERQLIQFDAEHLYALAAGEADGRYGRALESLPAHTIVFIDNFGQCAWNNNVLVQRMSILYHALLKRPDVQLVATLQPQEYDWLSEAHPAFTHLFEAVTLKPQTAAEYTEIAQIALARLNKDYKVVVPTAVLETIVEYVERFPTLGKLPRAATLILDECLSAATTAGAKMLSEETVATVVAGKTGVPLARLKADDVETLKDLEAELNARVVSQKEGIKKIAAAVTRAKLGMRNPNKPLGSFLILGPSGVGKTETAKLLAEKMFGRAESMHRFDMSEFGQEYTVQRLIGAPPGYVGYESGGALTNALKTEPHSLILLDEIEKAHPKVFDIFLQLLDDGRLTSGKNETADARHAIIMATSNIAVPEIVAGFQSGADIHGQKFMDEVIIPALTAHFRLEFINRFDSILVFNPLTMTDLVEIAKLEIEKVEKRLARHKVRFAVDPAVLARRVEKIADPRFGARPVKRFIEETCETLLTKSLLAKSNP